MTVLTSPGRSVLIDGTRVRRTAESQAAAASGLGRRAGARKDLVEPAKHVVGERDRGSTEGVVELFHRSGLSSSCRFTSLLDEDSLRTTETAVVSTL
jgi:hypothetical protein